MARDQSLFINFRLQRTLIDAVKEKRVKSYKDHKVLSSLIRVLLFESTKLLSNPGLTQELILYDTRLHEKLSLNQMFCFNKMHVVRKGTYNYPVKSFFVFAHNQPFDYQALKSHALVQLLKGVKTKDELM